MDSTAPETAPVCDESFYFEDDPMAIFLVENRLFKVHRHFFIQGSTIFRDMFAGAQAGDQDNAAAAVTMSKEPIPLPGVTVKEFQTLLRFFYAMTLPMSKVDTLAGLLKFDLDEKLALLSIAHRFVFDHIFECMCQKIQPGEVPVADRIRLGDKYDLTDWLSSAYEEILGRVCLECDTWEDEAGALGSDRVIKILKAKNFMLDESLKGIRNVATAMETDHRRHKNNCHLCVHCHYKTYRSSSGQEPTPTAAVVQRYLFDPLYGRSPYMSLVGFDVQDVQD